MFLAGRFWTTVVPNTRVQLLVHRYPSVFEILVNHVGQLYVYCCCYSFCSKKTHLTNNLAKILFSTRRTYVNFTVVQNLYLTQIDNNKNCTHKSPTTNDAFQQHSNSVADSACFESKTFLSAVPFHIINKSNPSPKRWEVKESISIHYNQITSTLTRIFEQCIVQIHSNSRSCSAILEGINIISIHSTLFRQRLERINKSSSLAISESIVLKINSNRLK